uniref:Uncharacterized protein n=1 Tax=Rousettus aegyptiacus TaxID=9407 RepID=A0A7J8EJU4_ROUAE|nr:hypothetical protein HJG63_012495 [Rousettus aegyptiacus]
MLIAGHPPLSRLGRIRPCLFSFTHLMFLRGGVTPRHILLFSTRHASRPSTVRPIDLEGVWEVLGPHERRTTAKMSVCLFPSRRRKARAHRGGGRQRSSESSDRGGESRSEEEHQVRDGPTPSTLGTHRRTVRQDPAVGRLECRNRS